MGTAVYIGTEGESAYGADGGEGADGADGFVVFADMLRDRYTTP
jgi:hypothetical protein